MRTCRPKVSPVGTGVVDVSTEGLSGRDRGRRRVDRRSPLEGRGTDVSTEDRTRDVLVRDCDTDVPERIPKGSDTQTGALVLGLVGRASQSRTCDSFTYSFFSFCVKASVEENSNSV